MPKPQTPYRWNAQETVWEFHEPAWGGWNTLRSRTHVTSPPMTFMEGVEYLKARGVDYEQCEGFPWFTFPVRPALSEGEPTPATGSLSPSAAPTKCPNPGCVNGRVGNVGCAVCKGLQPSDEDTPIGKHGPYGSHTAIDGSPVSPSLSTSSPELTKLLDELCLCVGQFEKVSSDWLLESAETYQMENAQKAINAARSAIELSFATLTEEIKRLREENTEARQILVEAVDRDISVKDTLRALASVASNGIFWRDKSIASLREELSEWLDRWNAREREVSVIRRSALTEYEARTLLIYLDAKHAGKPLPQGDDLVEFGKSADAKLRLISETPK